MNDDNDYLMCVQKHGLERTHHVLIAALGEKKLHLYESGSHVRTFEFSYSRNPVSCKHGSLGTPIGLHMVADKIGKGVAKGMIFKGRVETGQCWHERSDAGPRQKNFVTTRILRLKGLEPGLNSGAGVDSFERYIYIHGTNHPEKFPANISHGCLLLHDDDLIELFDKVAPGTHVYISE